MRRTIDTPLGTHTFETVPCAGMRFEMREYVDGCATGQQFIGYRQEVRDRIAARMREIRRSCRALRDLVADEPAPADD